MNHTTIPFIIILSFFTLGSVNSSFTNDLTDPDKMLLVMAAPSVNDTYYNEVFEQIVDFQIHYAQTVIGNDNVVVIVDADTAPYYAALPNDVILIADVGDIWVRDFSTVFPSQPIRFTYAPTYFPDLGNARFIQRSLTQLTNRLGLEIETSEFVLDGGNVVDNNQDAVVVSERFLEENDLTYEQGFTVLRDALGVPYVAIIPYDDPVMGHADGMVMFTQSDTLLVNTYDEPFRSSVLGALRDGLPHVTIIEVPAVFDDGGWGDFSSACGVNVNSTVTLNHIYVPTFGNTTDEIALAAIRANTDRTVHAIPADGVCFMGGSVRCLSWQLSGGNATLLIEAARG